MKGIMTHYYFFKKIIESLPEDLRNNFEITNDLLLNLSDFNSTPMFYNMKIDKYNIANSLINDSFIDLLVECLIEVNKNNDYQKLLFIYAIDSYYVLSNNLLEYFKSLNINTDEGFNNLDYYLTLNNDNLDISTTSILTLFNNPFSYLEYMEELIHNPYIKIYSFFATNSYFVKSMKNKRRYYKKYRYAINNNEELTSSYNEFINRIIDIELERIEAINKYLFDKNEKKLRLIYNLSSDKLL